MKKLLKLIISFYIVSISFYGCSKSVPKKEINENYVKEYKEVVVNYYQSNNQANSLKFRYIYSDIRALDVGDIVTIVITEDLTASTKDNSSLTKKNSISSGIKAFLGIGQDDLSKGEIGYNSSANFVGRGENAKKTQFTGYITAHVLEKLPNGKLIIGAKKEIIVNDEKQKVILTGIVDPIFISKDNEISSNKISDLQIKYIGEGDNRSTNEPGIITRLFLKFWPF